jgi:hypothetical protein
MKLQPVVRKLQFLNNFLKIAVLQAESRQTKGLQTARLEREPTGFPNKSILLLAITLSIASSVILTGALNADCFDHDCQTCTAPDCPICQRIEMAEIFIKALKLACIAFIFTGCFVLFAQNVNVHIPYNLHLLSPVALKVRFNS